MGGRGRRAGGISALLCVAATLLGAAAGPGARAQGATLRQLEHTAWTARDGAPADVVALAQSSDGFLWLGTTTGLYRFDGVRFERFEPPSGQRLPSLSVASLLAEPDGAVWVGYNFGGASVLAGGRFRHYGVADGLPPNTVNQLARDAGGALWAATNAGLLRLDGNRWRHAGAERGVPDTMIVALLVDRRGTLWASTLAGVYALPRGARTFVGRAPSLGPGNNATLTEAPDGSVWGASITAGLTRLSDAVGAPPPAEPRRGPPETYTVLVAADGGTWLGSRGGLSWLPARASVRAPPAIGDDEQRITHAQGLSSNTIVTFLQDREGSIWVGTAGGLDRFRATKLTRVSLPPDLISPAIGTGPRGALWIASASHTPFVVVPSRDDARPRTGAPRSIECAYRAPDGALWLGGQGTLWRSVTAPTDSGTFAPVPLPPELAQRSIQAIAQGPDGTLWLSGVRAGVFRRRGDAWARATAALDGGRLPATVIVGDDAGRQWLGYTHDRLVLAVNDSARLYSEADGLHVGTVTAVHVRGAHVWVGGETGLSQYVAGRFRSVVPATGVALLGITGIVEQKTGELWLNGAGGVTRIAAEELQRAARDTAYRVRAERFDYHDGLEGGAPQIRPFPSAIEGADGRIWFTTATGVLYVDPAHVRRNPVPPPVQIRAVDAGGRSYALGMPGDTVRLPARTTALQVRYTALSLAVPDRVRFRYRLEGSDRAWQDAGTRREAFYTNLGPGAYRFRVRAANDDGVWNEAGAVVDVVIPPTFVQTSTFAALCAAAAAGALWLLVQWRHRRATAAIRATFAVTLAERTRIAQELHDTLLQGFTGVTAQLYAVDRLLGARPAEAATVLTSALATADTALREAREAVWELRSAELDTLALPEALAAAARETLGPATVALRLAVDGAPRRLPHAVELTVLRLGREAVANAVRHADARSVDVTLAYEPHALRLCVRDDGRGFTPADAAHARHAGHWGLVGMAERVRQAGGTLAVASAPGDGTRIDVSLPLADGHVDQ